MDYTQRYGQWALVLGGSEGLGRAVACELAARGMSIALAARRIEPLEATAAMIAETYGVATLTIPIDLASDDVVGQIEAGMNGNDPAFIVYNAAAEPHGEFIDLDISDHLTNIAVNITAPTHIAHHFGRKMAARRRGGIVLCSSLAAGQGSYTWVGYGAAKAYENIVGEGLWYELGLRGVGACSFMIGMTWTDSFQRTQKKLGGIFAEGREPANLPAGWPLPQLPEEAAANLLTQIDKEWIPVIYANPDDIERVRAMSTMPRADLLRTYAETQRAWYDQPAE